MTISRAEGKVRQCDINSFTVIKLLHSILPHKTDYLKLENKTQDQVKSETRFHSILICHCDYIKLAQRSESLLSIRESIPLLLPFIRAIKNPSKRFPVKEVDKEG